MLMKENYQPEPVQGAQEDQAKRAAYDSAKAQRDKMVKIRNKNSREDVYHSQGLYA